MKRKCQSTGKLGMNYILQKRSKKNQNQDKMINWCGSCWRETIFKTSKNNGYIPVNNIDVLYEIITLGKILLVRTYVLKH